MIRSKFRDIKSTLKYQTKQSVVLTKGGSDIDEDISHRKHFRTSWGPKAKPIPSVIGEYLSLIMARLNSYSSLICVVWTLYGEEQHRGVDQSWL